MTSPSNELSSVKAASPTPPPKDSWLQVVLRLVVVLLAVSVLGWSARGAEIDFLELVRSSGNMLEFLKGFLHPEFVDWREYLREMTVTLQIAIWGTFLAVVFAVPCGLLSSANIAPFWIRQPVRWLMDAFRAINEMIFAMLFISAVGLGPFTGVLALFVHTLGTLSKLFSEAVEAVDERPVEGIRATGAGVLDEINYGVLPQIMPLWISYTLYRFESNIRSASVVGMVGAGGIGMTLWDSIRGFEYGRTSAMLIVIIVTVSLLDALSRRVRRYFL